MRKKTKKEKDRVEFKKLTWFIFITGIAFSLVGFYRFFYTSPSLMKNLKTQEPIMFDGSYFIFLGVLILFSGVYRIKYVKKP
jgi:amino acid transporter